MWLIGCIRNKTVVTICLVMVFCGVLKKSPVEILISSLVSEEIQANAKAALLSQTCMFKSDFFYVTPYLL